MTQSNYIPKGAASFKIAHVAAPCVFDFVLLPKLTMLALSAAIEPLRVANQISQQELYRWRTMTPGGAPVRCSNNLSLEADAPLGPPPRRARR